MSITSVDIGNENNRWNRKCDIRCVVMRWSNSEM